jgi:hypothetical protein
MPSVADMAITLSEASAPFISLRLDVLADPAVDLGEAHSGLAGGGQPAQRCR